MWMRSGWEYQYFFPFSKFVLLIPIFYLSFLSDELHHMGVSLNGGTPNLHPKMIVFSRKAPWLLGYHHFRKPPYIPKSIKFQPPPGGLWSDGFAGADPPVVVMSWKITAQKFNILLMEEILHQLIGSLSHYLYTRFYTSQVVQDFFHQQ